jgi:RNA polymerase sigma factor (sigma-70 family)
MGEMSNEVSDQDLLRRFALSGAEEAFRALAGRHTGLVFGTALRIVRERPAAEEVTQNVFIALVRKAAFLPADTCVGAWLHRSAVLEARNWVRGEVRRKRREEEAGGGMMEREESLLQPLMTVLDDALLDLREQDRAALLLRYMEQRNLKEVGRSLGVTEDTAQKRVSKAVELLTRAFRKRGYTVPSVAVTISLLEGVAQAAPLGLMASVAGAALSAAAPATSLSGVTLLVAKFMALTKVQTATMCVLLGAAPVAVHWEMNRQARLERERVERTAAVSAAELDGLRSQRSNLNRAWTLGQNELLGQLAERQRLAAMPRMELPPVEALYGWSEESKYVRLPKEVLSRLRLTPLKEQILPNGERLVGRGKVLDETGYVSPILLEALGLDPNQAANVQGAFLNFAADFNALVKARTVLTNSLPPGFNIGRPPGAELVTLRTDSFPDEGDELRERLSSTLEEMIGAERKEILMEKQAKYAFESDFLDFGKYEQWMAAVQQEGGLYTVARTQARNGRSYGGTITTIPYEGLPEELKPYFPRQNGE